MEIRVPTFSLSNFVFQITAYNELSSVTTPDIEIAVVLGCEVDDISLSRVPPTDIEENVLTSKGGSYIKLNQDG